MMSDIGDLSVATPPRLSRRIPLLAAGGGLVAGLVIGLLIVPSIASAVASAGPTAIEQAVDSCGVTPGSDISIGDDGASLSMQTAGEETDGADLADVACILTALDLPDNGLDIVIEPRRD
jgi:hypothetical protein